MMSQNASVPLFWRHFQWDAHTPHARQDVCMVILQHHALRTVSWVYTHISTTSSLHIHISHFSVMLSSLQHSHGLTISVGQILEGHPQNQTNAICIKLLLHNFFVLSVSSAMPECGPPSHFYVAYKHAKSKEFTCFAIHRLRFCLDPWPNRNN